MALQKQNIDINLAQGIETQVDEKVLESKNLIVENATFNKFMALQKCKGYEKISHLTSEGGDLEGQVKAVIAHGKNLIAVDSSRSFYSLKQSTGEFKKMEGAKFPAKMKAIDVFYQGNSQNYPDMDYSPTENSSVIAYEEYKAIGGIESRYFVSVAIYNHNHDEVFISQEIEHAVNPRVHFISSGGVTRVALLYTATSTTGAMSEGKFYFQLFDLEGKKIGSPVLYFDGGAAAGAEPVDSDSDGSSVYFCFKYNDSGTYKIKYGKANFDGTFSLQTYTPTFSVASINAEPTCRIVSGRLWLAWKSDGDYLIVKVYESDLTTSASSEQTIGDWAGTFVNVGKIQFTVTDDKFYFFYDVPYDILSDDIPVTYLLQIEVYALSGPAVGAREGHYSVNGAHMMSRPIVDYSGSSDRIFCLLGYESEIQKTNFFCEVELNPDGSAVPHVLARGLTGAASFSYSNTDISVAQGISIPKMIQSNGKFYAVDERSRRFSSTNIGRGVDGSSIEVVEYDMENFELQSEDFGETTVIAAGVVLDVAGDSVLENGHLLRPDKFEVISGPYSGISAGTYGYKLVFEAYNPYGELIRSAVSESKSITLGASGSVRIRAVIPPLGARMYEKSKLCVYRTKDAGTIYYKVNEFDLFNEVSPIENYGFVEYDDRLPDSTISANEALYTESGELETDAAPQAESISVGGNRAIVGGLQIENEIGFTKLGQYGVGPEFSDFFRISIDSAKRSEEGGISVAHIDDKIILLKASSTYYIIGAGPADNGQSNDFSTPQNISFDVGCSEKHSILNVPEGLIFKSKKGFYFLNQALNLQYIGNAVHDYDDVKVKSSLVVEEANEARFYLESGHTLVYHYLMDEWDVFTYPAQSAVNVSGQVYFVSNGIVFKDSSSFTFDSSFYSLKVRTPWLKLNTMQGFQRVRRAIVSGEYKSPHSLVMRIYFDYDTSTYEEHSITVDSAGPYSLGAHIANQKCSAIMFEIFDNPISGGESMELNMLTVEVGLKKGTAKLASSKRF